MAVLHKKLDRFKFFKFGGVMWDDAKTTKIMVLADSSDRTISLEVQWKVSPGHDGQREMCTYLNDLKKLISDKMKAVYPCLLYTSPSPRDRTRSRMPSSA